MYAANSQRKGIKRLAHLEQITRIHDQLGKRATLLQYLQALKAIGVHKCDSFISDGHSEYFGKEGHKVVSSSAHEKLKIAEVNNREDFIKHLNLHSQRKTNYLGMSRGLADSGVGKWTFDTNKMTMTYYDRGGNVMLVEERKFPCPGPETSSTDQSHIFRVPGFARHDLRVARQTTRIQAGIGGWCGAAL